MTLKVGMQHWALEYYQICSNDDAEMILTYFMVRSNLVPYAFVWEKGKTMNYLRKVNGPNHMDSIFLNFFSTITTSPIEAKFYVESHWDEGTKVCPNYLSHVTKMATMPIYG